MGTPTLWQRHQQYLCRAPDLGLTLDVSRMRFEEGLLDRMAQPLQRAFEAMDALERGSIANPDDDRAEDARRAAGSYEPVRVDRRLRR